MERKLYKIWQVLQTQFIPKIGSTQTVMSWMREMMDRILAATQKKWLTRNDIVHSKGKDGLSEKEPQDINHQTKQEYNKCSVDITPKEKLPLNGSVYELIKDQGIQKKVWLQKSI